MQFFCPLSSSKDSQPRSNDEMKPSFCFLATLFLFFTGAMSSPTSAQSDGDPGAADGDDDDADYMAPTNDAKQKHAGRFDDVPGIAGGGGCGGEFTSSPFLPFGVQGGGPADFGVIVAGTMTFVDSVCFDQPTVRASEGARAVCAV